MVGTVSWTFPWAPVGTRPVHDYPLHMVSHLDSGCRVLLGVPVVVWSSVSHSDTPRLEFISVGWHTLCLSVTLVRVSHTLAQQGVLPGAQTLDKME